jgi:hypothetical protein
MVLYTDATHVKANANTGKYDLAMIEKSRSDSWVDFGRAIDTERALHDQKPLKEKDREPEVKEAKVSRSGPDCAYMVRDGKPKGFFYLDHRLGDGKHANITDTHATPANVHGSIVYLEQLDRQRQRFGLNVGAFGLDAGYATSGIAHGVKERQILGITGYRNPTPRKPGMMSKSKFVHDREQYGYIAASRVICLPMPPPTAMGIATIARPCHLPRLSRSRLRAPHMPRRSAPSNVTSGPTHVTDRCQSPKSWGKAIYKRRKETVERSFADAKQLHGHRYAKFRTLIRVACQCLMAAAAQKIKKIATLLAKAH